MFIIIFILLCLPSLLLTIDFIRFLIVGTRFYSNTLTRLLEITGMLLLPLLYLNLLDEKINDCCNDSAAFSPNHRLTIYSLFLLCEIVYFYSSYKRKISSPIIEVLTNSILLFGFVLNIFVGIQVGDILWPVGNIPVGLLFIFRLVENHKAFLEITFKADYEPTSIF